MLISSFDPWNNELCTCPKKYSFNPYTGCSHACIYCYITSYIKRAFYPRLKTNLLKRLENELNKVDTYITMSNSSDPYIPEEKEFEVTRKCLHIFKENEISVLIVTKSDLVTRDAILLSNMNASVSMTVTTLDDVNSLKIEPYAPLPLKRIFALKKLHEYGVPCSVRLDPIIPGVNDGELEHIVDSVSPYVNHVVTSSIKPRYNSLKRLEKTINIDAHNWVKYGNAYYLKKDIRYELVERVKKACSKNGISFSTCREGYKVTSQSCDGSHLIPE